MTECRQLRIAVTTTPPLDRRDRVRERRPSRRPGSRGMGHHVVSDTPDWGIILQAALIPSEVPAICNGES